MTEAEHHQQQLERQRLHDDMIETIRKSVLGAPYDAEIAGVTGIHENRFTVIDFLGNRYTVTIEEQ